MSDKYDGSIIINTKMDNKGFDKGSEKLQSAIESLSKQVDALSSRLSGSFTGIGKAVSGSAKSVNELEKAVNRVGSGGKEKTELINADSIRRARLELEALEKQSNFGNESIAARFEKVRKSLSGMSASADKAETGDPDALESFWGEADQTRSVVQDLAKDLLALGNQRIPTQQFTELQKQIEEADKRLERLLDRKERMESYGQQGSTAYKNLSKDIEAARFQLETYQEERNEMLADKSGDPYLSAYTTPLQANPDLFGGYSEQLRAFEDELDGLENRVDEAVSPPGQAAAQWEQMSTFSGFVESAFQRASSAAVNFGATVSQVTHHPLQLLDRLAAAASNSVLNLGRRAISASAHLAKIAGARIVQGLKGIAGYAAAAAKSLFGLGSSVNKSTGAFKLGLWNMIRYGIGVRSVFALVNRLRSAIVQGFGNLAQYSSPVNAALSSVKGSLEQLKNSLATAFAPIFTAIAPAVNYLCGLLATALGYIAQFMSAITGGKTFIKATKQVNDYAKGLSGAGAAGSEAGKSAKEASKQLASFDKLNILTDDSKNNGGSGGGGGAGGSGAGAADMFETLPIESAIADFVQRIKDAFAAGEYEEVGRIIAEGINSAVQKVRNFISWENVHSFWEHWIDAFCRIANSLVRNIDWYAIGATIAEGLNTVLHILELLLTGIDWGLLGRSLGDALNGLTDYIDWALIGRVLGERFQAAIDAIHGAISTYRWENLGKGLASAVNSLVGTIDWKKAGETISGGIRGLLGAFNSAVDNTDWGEIGKAIADTLGAVDWSGIARDAFHGLGSISGAVAGILGGMLSDAIDGAKQFFTRKTQECGGNVVLGIFSGILDAIKGVGKWVVDNIFSPFTEGFKDAFGINSPAKEMEPYGAYIFEGVLKGILRGVKGIGKWAKKHILEPIQKALGGSNNSLQLTAVVEFVKKAGQTLAGLIGNAMRATVSFIKKSGQTLTGLIGAAMTATVSFAKKSGQTLERLIGTTSKATVSFIKKSGQTLEKLIGDAMKATVSFIKKSGQTLEKLIGTASKATVSFVKKSGQTLEKLIGTASKATVSFIKKSGQSLEKLIGTWMTATVNFIKKSGQTLAGLIGTWLTATVNFIKRSGQTLGGLIGTWLDATVNFVKRSGQTLGGLIGTWLNVTVNFISRAGQSLRSLLGLSGGGAIIGNSVHLFASGGVIRGGHMSWWDSIQKYGSGTHSAHGTAFIAGEAGPEIVGHVNGRTEVLNKSQLADAIYSAVLAAASNAVKAITGYIGRCLVTCANGIIAALYTVSDFAEPVPVSVIRFPDLRIPDAGVLRVMNMLGELSAVRYTPPTMSTGTVMPYSAQAGSSTQRKSGIDEADLDELGQVVVSAISSAALALVTAIQQSSARGEKIDLPDLTQRTIDDINRRTRMYSTSPII